MSVWRIVITIRGVKDLVGNYMWLDKAQYKYIEAMKFFPNNKDWKEGGNCLELAMGSNWWEWSEG